MSTSSVPLDSSREICLRPDASDLLESMRALGYSFESAIADLIDNSLFAEATAIQIRFSAMDQPFLAILDDGKGMQPDALTAAMRHGSRNPDLLRNEEDLGRFGLGLKTASLSQCRRLTVLSLQSGILSGRCWDLDHVALRKDWILLSLSEAEICSLPVVEQLVSQGHGTVVLWQEFDRLGAGEPSLKRALENRMDHLREHLALVFHRFLTPEAGRPSVLVSINNHRVSAVDPFLTRNKATQVLHSEEFILDGQQVRVQPYILPHLSRLSDADLKLAGGEDGLRRNQGFYVYRNRRLICWGSWFRLVRQEELTKLARVQVDLSNRLDHLWKLDIKKSTTYPPEALREGLKQIIGRITEGSRNLFVFRGKKASSEKVVHAWDRTLVRNGIAYLINRQHPALQALMGTVSKEGQPLLEEVLGVLEQSLPLDAIYLDKASHTQMMTEEEDETAKLEALVSQLLAAVGKTSEAGRRLLATLPAIEPFSFNPAVARDIAQRYSHE